jgi:hypothetical protein
VSARSAAARVSDVRALLVAASVARDRHGIGAEIARMTGLSPEGVRLALDEHLEIAATDSELELLVDRAGDAPRVHVILSAGVFVGALRALAVAYASSGVVTVRPSRRDPVFARALVEALGRPAVSLGDSPALAGEVHVYGTDETNARVAAGAWPGVVVRRHGSGLGVAAVSRAADVASAAVLVAADVVPFDQRGCLSPRVVLVEGDEARACDFAGALDAALGAAGSRIPRGWLSEDERAQASRYMQTVAFAGRVWRGSAHGIGSSSGPLLMPPPGRYVHVRAVSDAADARLCLAPIARYIVAFGTDDPGRLAAWAPESARVSALGFMQRPPLDGPVDLRAFSPSA